MNEYFGGGHLYDFFDIRHFFELWPIKNITGGPRESVEEIQKTKNFILTVKTLRKLDRCNSGRALFVERSFSLTDFAHYHTVIY